MITLHRLNAGNYVTDRSEPVGSWVVYQYRKPITDAPDGWAVCEWVLDDAGYPNLEFREWTRTLADARAEVTTRMEWVTK